jgi:hypothetical protein
MYRRRVLSIATAGCEFNIDMRLFDWLAGSVPAAYRSNSAERTMSRPSPFTWSDVTSRIAAPQRSDWPVVSLMAVLALELALVAGGVMQSEVGLLAALDLVGLALSVVISRRSGQAWPLAVMGAQLTAVACLLLYHPGDGRPVAAWLAAHVTGLVMLTPVLLVRFWAPRNRLVTEP